MIFYWFCFAHTNCKCVDCKVIPKPEHALNRITLYLTIGHDFDVEILRPSEPPCSLEVESSTSESHCNSKAFQKVLHVHLYVLLSCLYEIVTED